MVSTTRTSRFGGFGLSPLFVVASHEVRIRSTQERQRTRRVVRLPGGFGLVSGGDAIHTVFGLIPALFLDDGLAVGHQAVEHLAAQFRLYAANLDGVLSNAADASHLDDIFLLDGV